MCVITLKLMCIMYLILICVIIELNLYDRVEFVYLGKIDERVTNKILLCSMMHQ